MGSRTVGPHPFRTPRRSAGCTNGRAFALAGQALVPPARTLAHLCSRQSGAAFGMDAGQQFWIPFVPGLLARYLTIGPSVTGRIVDHAARRIQVDGLERPHE